jgi:hypothetical protein
MSIEQKIAKLLEESKKLQAEEITVDGLTKEQFQALSEEEQALYELSKKALGNYVKKAADSASSHAYETGYIQGYDDDDVSDETAAEVSHHKSKTDKREKGIDRAVKRLTKEQIEVDVSEDVAALINGEELTEAFKTKAATIFEAAVVNRVKAEVAKLEEAFDLTLAEQVEEIKEGLVEQVDGYLSYVAEQWMTHNELALEHGVKTEIMESFIAGMKGLFEQHNIDVPEEKYDMLAGLQEEAEDIKSKLDEQLAANIELTKQIAEMKRVAEIAEFSASMADTDAEKFKGLAEELAYDDAESFKTKLQTIKENYFGKKVTPTVTSVVTDEPVQLDEEVKAIDPRMAKYLAALK